MSTPDQPSTPPLTRRQLRELRNTASTPIITPEEAQADAEASDATAREAAAAEREAEAAPDHTPAPLDDHVEPHPDERPLSRRQARQLATSRTGAFEVIPEEPSTGDVETPDADVEPPAEETPAEEDDQASTPPAEDADDAPAEDAAAGEESIEVDHPADAEDPVPSDEHDDVVHPEAEADDRPARVVAPDLGAQLLEQGAAPVDLPPSFDHLLTRGGSGTASAPNALILSQTPETGALSVPILGTGELIITGSYALPDTFGSTGTAPGASDGKDADAALIDGELPPASSPTPIAASAAISTIKSADEIIRPPAPEKGSRLMMTLAICAGVLGLAVATVLILILTNGTF